VLEIVAGYERWPSGIELSLIRNFCSASSTMWTMTDWMTRAVPATQFDDPVCRDVERRDEGTNF